MAARRPIVSTPIADVAGPYADIVHLGTGVAEFVAACERALAPPDSERMPLNDIQTAAAKQLARDLSSAQLIESTVSDRIINFLTNPEPAQKAEEKK